MNNLELLDHSSNNLELLDHSLASLAKWLSVRLRTKWFWVRVQLQFPANSLYSLNSLQITFTSENFKIYADINGFESSNALFKNA